MNFKNFSVRLLNGLIAKRRKVAREFSKGVGLNYLAHSNIKLFPDLNSLFTESEPLTSLQKYRAEGIGVYARILEEKSGRNAPLRFDAGENFAVFLYCLIRETKPLRVVETGVANGITTNMILAAMSDYDGELHSFDTNPECSNVSSQMNWKFHLLRKPFKRNIKKSMRRIGRVNLWIHDSDHSRDWQLFEYRLASNYMDFRGILVSDDIDSSSAFSAVCRKSGNTGIAIFDKTKLFGFLDINFNS